MDRTVTDRSSLDKAANWLFDIGRASFDERHERVAKLLEQAHVGESAQRVQERQSQEMDALERRVAGAEMVAARADERRADLELLLQRSEVQHNDEIRRLQRDHEARAGRLQELQQQVNNLTIQVGEGPADKIVSLTKELEIAHKTGARRQAAALTASEGRRQRIVELESENARLKRDHATQVETHRLALAQQRAEAHQRHAADSSMIHNQRRQLREIERVHEQHGSERKRLREEVSGLTAYVSVLISELARRGGVIPARQSASAAIDPYEGFARHLAGLSENLYDVQSSMAEQVAAKAEAMASETRSTEITDRGIPIWRLDSLGNREVIGYGRVNPSNGHIEFR